MNNTKKEENHLPELKEEETRKALIEDWKSMNFKRHYPDCDVDLYYRRQ